MKWHYLNVIATYSNTLCSFKLLANKVASKKNELVYLYIRKKDNSMQVYVAS